MRTYSALIRCLALMPPPVMASFTPLRYPMPYPITQTAIAQPEIRSQVRPVGIVHTMCRVATRGEVTSSDSSHPNASSPSGPATCRGANPTYPWRTSSIAGEAPGSAPVALAGDGSSLGRDGRERYHAGECGKDRPHFSLQRGTREAIWTATIDTT
jgi:hypothetical protein